MILHGRRFITTDEQQITRDNVVAVLYEALNTHNINRSEIKYLWKYYCGDQPILQREKEVRPEINNKVVENRANEIVTFKSGYLLGEPLQCVSKGTSENLTEPLTQLNEYLELESKSAKDKELSDFSHIFGTAYRIVLPKETDDEDDAPFEIYNLFTPNTFVVYSNSLGNKPMMGVYYVIDKMGIPTYSCYTETEYFEIRMDKVVKHEGHILGSIPIIEYPLNIARIGAFELVLSLLDSINLTDSNRVDGVEQFIQALMLFHNVDIVEDDFIKMHDLGALKFKDVDPTLKGEVDYLINNLNQGETQVLVDHMYQTVLTICGMPNRNGGTSTSDTGTAVVYRDGWSAAETRARDTELIFKKSERNLLKIILKICKILRGLDLKVKNVEIRFTRRNYENILQKAEVLNMMLNNPKIDPQLAFTHSGLFVDAELAYQKSMEYYEEEQRKEEERMKEQMELGGGNDPEINTGNGGNDRNPSKTRKQGGSVDRTGKDRNS